MKELITISLSDLRFFAYHGLFQEEGTIGTEFSVDLEATYVPPAGTIDSIHDTINYAEVYSLIDKEMKIRRELLETLTMDIAGKIQEAWPMVKSISITITKLNPPILAFDGQVAVTYSRDFD